MDRKAHWEQVYGTKASDEVSWYQPEAARSLALLREVGAGSQTAIIDVGGGDSTLVDSVVAAGLGRMTVLDLSAAALARSRMRLGERADDVRWIEADVTRATLPPGAFDVWHDRAVFHFLTDAEDRLRYAALAASALRPGAVVLMATFAPDGPVRCSGLAVVRYAPDALARELGDAFTLERALADVHHTPAGNVQRFTVAVLRRR